MKRPRKNWLEWTVFAFGLVALLGTTTFLTVHAVRHDGRPPALSIELGQPWTHADVTPPYVVVPVTVRNDGDCAATEVDVSVSVTRAGQLVEQGSLNIDELPRQSQRGGAVTLRAMPGPGELHARIVSYADP
jgi:uncharacterized protein (TIGR02588 family)